MKLIWQADGTLDRELDTGVSIVYRSGKWWVNPDSTYRQTTSAGQSCYQMEKEGGKLYRVRNGKRVHAPIPLNK